MLLSLLALPLPGRAQNPDSLREAIGTCPMAEYVRLLEETSGAKVVCDPALTVDSLKRIVGRKALF